MRIEGEGRKFCIGEPGKSKVPVDLQQQKY
jgi:hypothetical protein